jgi:hypothetical protein
LKNPDFIEKTLKSQRFFIRKNMFLQRLTNMGNVLCLEVKIDQNETVTRATSMDFHISTSSVS